MLKRGKLIGGGALFLVLVALGIGSLFLDESVYRQSLESRLAPPLWAPGGDANHLLGADSLGRDVLARTMAGLGVSLQVGLASVALGSVLGLMFGMVSGFYGGWVDATLMRVTDAVIAIPVVLLALSVIAIIGGGIVNLILVIALTQWMVYSRTARSEVMVLRELPFVTAAKSIGCTDRQTIIRHCLPNVMPSALVLATLGISEAVLLEAGLSFLGLGVQPPSPSLGAMLSEGREFMYESAWLAVVPGAVLVLLVLAVNVLGDGLREYIHRGRE